MTNEAFRFIVRDQCAALGLTDAEVIIEPHLRNTGPAILSSALFYRDRPDALLFVAPCDHAISDPQKLVDAILTGSRAAASGALVTFGVAPSGPETGYGYLDFGEDADMAGGVQTVHAFTEKPDLDTAQRFVDGGRHWWNSGMFLFRVRDILKAYEDAAPDMILPCTAAVDLGQRDLGLFRLDSDAYEQVRAESVDFAIMEKADNVKAVKIDASWSDLGSWETVWAYLEPDSEGVVLQGEAMAIDCKNALLRSEDPDIQLVGLGLKNLVAIAMRDAVLVADMSQSQRIKDAVSILKRDGVPQAEDHPRFHRPWGWYETLCLGERFRVKRIMVAPGGVLSLQSHTSRAEHWVVVAGRARVTIGDSEQDLMENQSVYIPLGAVHRLANPYDAPMHLVEVQTGAYLGEDDITRYEDVYNRVDQ